MARYHVNERPVPSVTEILRELLPQWQASEWHLQRGTAVHACCAMIARGVEFTNDPQIAGQVAAAKKWFEDFRPIPIYVEVPWTSNAYMFGGTPDLYCGMDKRDVVVDFKASLTPTVVFQLGGYAELLNEAGIRAKWGLGVELREDGTYTTTGLLKLDIPRREFLALRTVYGIRERLGMLQTKQEEV